MSKHDARELKISGITPQVLKSKLLNFQISIFSKNEFLGRKLLIDNFPFSTLKNGQNL